MDCRLCSCHTPVAFLGMLYMDVLQTRNEAQEQVQKVEKLRRQIEQKEREKEK